MTASMVIYQNNYKIVHWIAWPFLVFACGLGALVTFALPTIGGIHWPSAITTIIVGGGLAYCLLCVMPLKIVITDTNVTARYILPAKNRSWDLKSVDASVTRDLRTNSSNNVASYTLNLTNRDNSDSIGIGLARDEAEKIKAAIDLAKGLADEANG